MSTFHNITGLIQAQQLRGGPPFGLNAQVGAHFANPLVIPHPHKDIMCAAVGGPVQFRDIHQMIVGGVRGVLYLYPIAC